MIHKKGHQEKGFAFRKLAKPSDEVYNEFEYKALVKFKEYERGNLSTAVDIENPKAKSAAQDQPGDIDAKENQTTESQIPDYNSSSLELISLPEEPPYKDHLDIRSKMNKLVTGKIKYRFEEKEEQQQAYEKCMEVGKEIMNSKEESYLNMEPWKDGSGVHQQNQQSTPASWNDRGMLKPMMDKEALTSLKEYSNDHYYLTKKALSYLKEKY